MTHEDRVFLAYLSVCMGDRISCAIYNNAQMNAGSDYLEPRSSEDAYATAKDIVAFVALQQGPKVEA